MKDSVLVLPAPFCLHVMPPIWTNINSRMGGLKGRQLEDTIGAVGCSSSFPSPCHLGGTSAQFGSWFAVMLGVFKSGGYILARSTKNGFHLPKLKDSWHK